ncbi:MAG: flagellar hook-associated protein FlgK [Nitrospinaceae bacterium]|nr:flagellar hook-associated protein FlgK [Nitrospinaceae bacterium]NIR53409.1 flagellar hook-associated protein FlgK [Nitrospinaceae bacterium]NIS83813.1 flagellar hook-associated protein FlgK [Nitrospinaceae bacterium]NIT80609.1 flagellar hook-associated protein FlgK [Nitrospinaceae bacterium]NIU42933.1 flagellar hook-associated protein FlgK [Nitrospinaceae bacterium]
MTTNIFSALNTAKLGLQTNQLAIEVTGNNIANVQTEGYSKQNVALVNNRPRRVGLGFLGTGVRAESVTRNFDQFLFNRILGENGTLGNFNVRRTMFERLEIILNESAGTSLNNAMSEFFKAFDDLASNPINPGARTAVVGTAQELANIFNRIGTSLFQERVALDDRVADEVGQINSALDEIAKLNKIISGDEVNRFPANDLRDQRDLLVKDLGEKLNVNLVDTNDNQVMLTLGNGTPIIVGDQVFRLSTAPNPDNQGFLDVFADDNAGGTINVTSAIFGGEMKGLLDMRDQEIPNLLDQLDRLAAGLMEEVNRVHQQGLDLNGAKGGNFFDPLTPTVVPSSLNTGTGIVSMVNASPSTVNVDKFQMQFTTATDFDLIDTTTGQNLGSFNFTPGSTFNLVGGLAVTITGSPAAGDVVDFSVSESAAFNMSVSSAILADTDRIAAGLNSIGDGQNALEISNLQNRLVFSGSAFSPGSGNSTFDDFYNSLISGLGNGSRSAQTVAAQQEGVMLQLNTQRESISGVSLDEEMVNLIKFQQAFAASARMITVIEEMFDVLQNQI